MPSFVASLDRLVALARSRKVTVVMGCHIEMSRTPGRDYPIGSTWQPDEAPLPMSVEHSSASGTRHAWWPTVRAHTCSTT